MGKWRFKKQYENTRIVTADRITVDQFTITDTLVDHLLLLSADHAEYFERDKNDDPGQQVKPKRLPDERKSI